MDLSALISSQLTERPVSFVTKTDA